MTIQLELLEASYWEHFKKAKDLSLYLPLKDKRRVELENEMNKILKQIHVLK